MKKIVPLSVLFFFYLTAFAQVPQKFTYQAVATDNQGVELANTSMMIRASVLSGSASGNPEWIEIHPIQTDEFGLFTIDVGTMSNNGGSQSSFQNIPWGDNIYFLRVEMDISNTGVNYVIVGAKPLNSVPYALYSAGADQAKTALDDNDRDQTNEIQDFVLNGSMLSLTNSTGDPVDLADLPFDVSDADDDPENEIQDFVLNGSMLSLTNSTGDPVDLADLPFDVSDADDDPENEIQDFVLNGSMLSLTNSTGDPVDLADLPFDVSDADDDPENEIQDFVLNGSMLSLSNSTGNPLDLANLPINIDDADANPQNEIQDFELNGTVLSLTQSAGNPIDLATLPVGSDPDPTNELQELYINGDTLGLSNGNSLLLSDALSGAGGFNDPGATIDYPQGVTNATYIFKSDNYMVPTGKTFFVIAAEDEIRFPGIGNDLGRHLTGPNMPIIPENIQIDNCRCIGFLKDKDDRVTPDLIVLEPNQGNSYSVPSGKNFVIKSGLDATTPLTLDGTTVNFFSGTLKAIVIPSDVVIRNIGNDEVILTGYMIDNF